MYRINSLLKSMSISFLQQGQKYKEYCYIFGGIGIIYFLSSSFFMPITVTKVLYIAAYLKAVAAILCLGLCMHTTHLNAKQQAKYMPWYWYIMLLYCLPFLSSYIALTYDYDLPWSINLVLSLAILYLVSNWSVAFILSTIGFLAGYLLFKVTDYSLAVNDLTGHSRISSYIYCFLTGVILVALQQKDRFNPLDSSSVEANEVPGVLVGNIYSSIADIAKAVDKGLYGIGECVQEALGEYRFKGHERMRIRVDMVGRNFQFKGSKFFMKQIIMNLIDNSLKYAGSTAAINIWSEGRTLNIRDNGKGIDSEVLKRDIFSANSIGLSFCKRAMEAMGGTIRCESGLGKGTKFELTFPKLP